MASTEVKMSKTQELDTLPDDALVTYEKGVKQLVPISRHSWMDGCKAGIYPAPQKIGPRLKAWRLGTLRQFCRGEWQPTHGRAA